MYLDCTYGIHRLLPRARPHYCAMLIDSRPLGHADYFDRRLLGHADYFDCRLLGHTDYFDSAMNQARSYLVNIYQLNIL
jgi:hypothetical protein